MLQVPGLLPLSAYSDPFQSQRTWESASASVSRLPQSMWTTSNWLEESGRLLLWCTLDTSCLVRRCVWVWSGLRHPQRMYKYMSGGWTEQMYQDASISPISLGGRVICTLQWYSCHRSERWFLSGWWCLCVHVHTQLILFQVSDHWRAVTEDYYTTRTAPYVLWVVSTSVQPPLKLLLSRVSIQVWRRLIYNFLEHA